MPKENQVQFQTLFPARLPLRYKDGTVIYDNIEEATGDKRGFTVKIFKPLETLKEQIKQLTQTKLGRRMKDKLHF